MSLVDDPTEPDQEACSFVSVESLFPVQWTTELDDHVLELQWSPDSQWLAALPTTGSH